MSKADPPCQQEGTAAAEVPPASKPPGHLEAMRRKLEEHSPLEDLGPLFGPQAQGTGRGES